ncbi:unnamed protein product, partial [Ectocarpus sp. 12 AP-2014]
MECSCVLSGFTTTNGQAYKRGQPDDPEGYCCCGRQHQRLPSW